MKIWGRLKKVTIVSLDPQPRCAISWNISLKLGVASSWRWTKQWENSTRALSSRGSQNMVWKTNNNQTLEGENFKLYFSLCMTPHLSLCHNQPIPCGGHRQTQTEEFSFRFKHNSGSWNLRDTDSHRKCWSYCVWVMSGDEKWKDFYYYIIEIKLRFTKFYLIFGR